jgi:predicted GTPase
LKVIPALGYGKSQIKELEKSINNAIKKTKCDLVLLGTSSNLSNYIKIDKPAVRTKYEIKEIGKKLESLIH